MRLEDKFKIKFFKNPHGNQTSVAVIRDSDFPQNDFSIKIPGFSFFFYFSLIVTIFNVSEAPLRTQRVKELYLCEVLILNQVL